ncbi:MAG: NrfD/PsrC family molybdoenzyme membrane anchor subunit [Acidimicrobiales bacterium]
MSNQSKVGRNGQEGTRPGREATTGAHAAGDNGSSSPGGSSYYGLPVLNEPVWEARDIAGYLFLGGLAGASSAVGAGAQLTGRRSLARVAKLGAAGGAGLSLVALVHDLGRPSRFLNMLRVFKVTSPMSVGSWLLAVFGPATMVAAASELSGIAPTVGVAATAGAAILGPAVAAYTAALVADTAVPSWHDGFRHMPFVFVASGAAAAAGLGLLAVTPEESVPVQRLALVAGPAEIALTRLMEQRMGMASEPYRRGRAGAYMKAAEGLTALGTIAAPFARRSRQAGAVAGAALLLGSAFERFGIFHAGVQSVKDPKYTVAPQRERRSAATTRA